MIRSLVYIVLFACCSSSLALEEMRTEPLLMNSDFSSPQATLHTCRTMLQTIIARQDESPGNIHDYLGAIPLELARLRSCFDYSQIPPERIDDYEVENALLLAEILDRMPLPKAGDIPDREAVIELGINSWRIPGSLIAIVRVVEGDREGEWLISAVSTANLQHIYERIKHLPYQADAISGKIGSQGGVYDYYLLEPSGTLVSGLLTGESFPSWMQRLYLGQPFWKLLAISLVLCFSIAIWSGIFFLTRLVKPAAPPFRIHRAWLRLLAPLFGIAIAVVAEWLIDENIGPAGSLAERMEVVLLTSAWCFLGWLIADLGNLVVVYVKRHRGLESAEHGLAEIAVRTLSIVLAVWIVLAGIEELGISLLPLLAGLGVGGLAVALAVRPTLENLIAGLIIYADKPIEVGERCRYGQRIGDVQSIGLRSTRIRDINGALNSIPNSIFSEMEIENISRRERTLFAPTLSLRYETTPAQLENLIAELFTMLRCHENVLTEDLRVRFVGFGSYALEVAVQAYIDTGDRSRFLAIQQDLNLRIMKNVAKADTEFAFPSQTTYLRPDSGMNTPSRGEKSTIPQNHPA